MISSGQVKQLVERLKAQAKINIELYNDQRRPIASRREFLCIGTEQEKLASNLEALDKPVSQSQMEKVAKELHKRWGFRSWLAEEVGGNVAWWKGQAEELIALIQPEPPKGVVVTPQSQGLRMIIDKMRAKANNYHDLESTYGSGVCTILTEYADELERLTPQPTEAGLTDKEIERICAGVLLEDSRIRLVSDAATAKAYAAGVAEVTANPDKHSLMSKKLRRS